MFDEVAIDFLVVAVHLAQEVERDTGTIANVYWVRLDREVAADDQWVTRHHHALLPIFPLHGYWAEWREEVVHRHECDDVGTNNLFDTDFLTFIGKRGHAPQVSEIELMYATQHAGIEDGNQDPGARIVVVLSMNVLLVVVFHDGLFLLVRVALWPMSSN